MRFESMNSWLTVAILLLWVWDSFNICVSAAVLHRFESRWSPENIFRGSLRLFQSQRRLRWTHLHFICMSAAHIIFICFIPFTGAMNSTNWPAPNVWIFISQLVEHCSDNADAMGLNPVEAPKTFFRLNFHCLNRKHNCDDYTFISFVCPQFT